MIESDIVTEPQPKVVILYGGETYTTVEPIPSNVDLCDYSAKFFSKSKTLEIIFSIHSS